MTLASPFPAEVREILVECLERVEAKPSPCGIERREKSIEEFWRLDQAKRFLPRTN